MRLVEESRNPRREKRRTVHAQERMGNLEGGDIFTIWLKKKKKKEKKKEKKRKKAKRGQERN